MTTIDVHEKNPSRSAGPALVAVNRQDVQGSGAYEFDAVACPEDEGGFSIFAVHYPGIVSQGETLDEARTNVSEAFLAMLEAAQARGVKLEYSTTPWMDATPGAIRLRVTVHG
jgi:predicted RNase H-like HicB family nuclease